jgi:hypothetical protein
MEMTMRHLSTGRFGVFGITLLLMLAASGRATAAAEDDTTDAGRSGGDIYSIVNLAAPTSYNGFVNARGQAAFEYPGPDGRTQVAFFNGDRIVDISPPGNERTFVGGLNEQGEVIFNARFLDAQSPGGLRYQPLRWSAAMGRVVLPSLNAREYASLDAINKHGQIAGLSATSSDNSSVRAVRWTSFQALPTTSTISMPSSARAALSMAVRPRWSGTLTAVPRILERSGHAVRMVSASIIRATFSVGGSSTLQPGASSCRAQENPLSASMPPIPRHSMKRARSSAQCGARPRTSFAPSGTHARAVFSACTRRACSRPRPTH